MPQFAPRFSPVVCAVSPKFRAWCLRAALCSALAAGCGSGPYDVPPPTPDYALFVNQVYPVLLSDCGFAACHGDHTRFFHVFGPGRVRLDPAMDPFDPATTAEMQQSYARARSMVRADTPLESLLLRKPLETVAGGAGHRGTDELGRNVYLTAEAPHLQVLRNWATQPSTAPVPGAVAP